jgi:hypothetical protein
MWDSEMVTLLRHMIDDVSSTPKYADERLMQLILVGAQFAKEENVFGVDYIIDIENMTLKPDPTLRSERDDAFINLSLLKAACMLAGSGLSKGGGLAVKEAGYSFDSRGVTEGKKLQVMTWCQAYKDAKKEFSFTSLPPGEAIIGPYRSCETRGLYTHRDRMW